LSVRIFLGDLRDLAATELLDGRLRYEFSL